MNVYLPDELALAAKAAALNLSALTQEGVRGALAARATDAWLDCRRPSVPPVDHEHAMTALDRARDDPATRHG